MFVAVALVVVVQRVREGRLRRVLVGQQELVDVAVVVVQEVQVAQGRVQVGQHVLVEVVVVVVPEVRVEQREVVGSSSSAAAAGRVEPAVRVFPRQWSFQVVAAVVVVPPLGARLVQVEQVVRVAPVVLREVVVVGEVELVLQVVQVVLVVRDRLLLLGCVLRVLEVEPVLRVVQVVQVVRGRLLLLAGVPRVLRWCRPGRRTQLFFRCRRPAGRWASPRTVWTIARGPLLPLGPAGASVRTGRAPGVVVCSVLEEVVPVVLVVAAGQSGSVARPRVPPRLLGAWASLPLVARARPLCPGWWPLRWVLPRPRCVPEKPLRSGVPLCPGSRRGAPAGAGSLLVLVVAGAGVPLPFLLPLLRGVLSLSLSLCIYRSLSLSLSLSLCLHTHTEDAAALFSASPVPACLASRLKSMTLWWTSGSNRHQISV